MTKNVGYALLAALAAMVVLISTAVLVGSGSDPHGTDSSRRDPDAADPGAAGTWVGTWSAAPAAAEPHTADGFARMSIRNVVHTSVGGTRVRIRLSNLFGNRPLTFSHATVALAAAPSNPNAAAGTMRRLTFDDSRAVTIPAGGRTTSDAVALNVPPNADLLVTTYAPNPSGPVTYHPYTRQTSFVASGDVAAESDGSAYTQQTPYWRYLTGVDVLSSEAEGAVVVVGDSLTDGISSSPGANRRWTDFLADRLRTERGAPRYSVLNAGISGNRVLIDGHKYSPNNGPSALNRMQQDALSQTGVKAVVVELGLNDILKEPRERNPARIVAGLKQLVQQAHQRGLRILGGTLTPFRGYVRWTPEREAVRQAVNEAIRSGDVFDAVVDLDAALRDPAHPQRLRTTYDSGDHLHPSDNGYRAMARALDLAALKGSTPARL
jgi:lysophospholipase L1-like esterase